MTIPYTGMRLVPAFFAIAAAATAGSAGRVPPELAVIGEPSTVLKVTYSVASSKFSFKPSISKDAPQPHLHDLGLSNTNRYLLLVVDPGWNKTSPPSVIVHTVVANLTTNVNSTSKANIIATYIAPQPNSGTHNYTLFLFSQPPNFSIPTGIEAPVAANYFRVTSSNGTSAGTAATTTTRTVASSTSSGAVINMVANNYLAGALTLVGAAAFNIAQIVLASGGAITFAALADKYGLPEADMRRLVHHAIFEEPRNNEAVHTRDSMLEAEVGERDDFE
ncbi:Phosphatidylethanolamine-binding protein PEBP [Penicillium camemberti]|uniref:Phosphatidylethanolamine-binding protein PEBP n=1 Tax=Penicillium camemberti (strain FM 013) TaxID=1429867 RepID=A0A0G4NYS8_PENC3|nr:Phosphatidylethanolamine-binding protein PEBP [Penicillium camemberti]